MIQNTLSIVYESSENAQKTLKLGKEFTKNENMNRINGKRSEIKSTLKNNNEKKKVIYFFQDFVSTSNSDIKFQDSLSLTSVGSKDIWNGACKSHIRELEKQKNSVSKFSAYKSLFNRMEHKENYQKNENYNTKDQNENSTTKTDEASNGSISLSRTDDILQNKVDFLNEELKSMIQKRSDFKTSIEMMGKDTSVETLETKRKSSGVQFQMISEIFSSLPPSNRVLNEFVHFTKKNKYTVKQEYKYKRSLEKISTKPIEIISRREINSQTDFHHFKQVDHISSDLVQNNSAQKSLLQPSSSSFDFCPESMNLLKCALLTEMSHRNKKSEDSEIFYQGLENSLKEYVTKLINELRANNRENGYQSKLNDTKEIERDHEKAGKDKLNKLNYISDDREIVYHSKLNDTMEIKRDHEKSLGKDRLTNITGEEIHFPSKNNPQKTLNRVEYDIGLSTKYNKALKQFKHTLLKSDSDSSIVYNNKAKTMKKSTLHCKVIKSDNRKKNLKVSPNPCNDFMKNRKIEVEQKLKEYSRKRTKLTYKKKSPNTEVIKHITRQKIKPQREDSELNNSIIPPIQKNKISNKIVVNNASSKWRFKKKRQLEKEHNYMIIPQGDGIILRRKNETLYIIDSSQSPFRAGHRKKPCFQRSLENLSSQHNTLGK